MLCVRTGASQPPADVDDAEHARRRFARRPEPENTREMSKTTRVRKAVLSRTGAGRATAW